MSKSPKKKAKRVAPTVATGGPGGGGRTKSDAGWLRDYLRASFYLGRLSPGDRLPSHRELAKQIGISSSTALELYHTLEADGLLSSRERSGTFLRQVAIEADRDKRHNAVFGLITTAVSRLDLLSFSVIEYLRLVRWYVGEEARPNFNFGLVMNSEAFELASATIEQSCRTALPMIRLSPNPNDPHWAKAVVARNRTIKCLVATYLHLELASDIARRFDRHLLLARPDQTVESVFDIPPGGTRYIVTRDRETAVDLMALIRKILEPEKANHFVIAALTDVELIERIAQEADSVVVAPLAYSSARARFGPAKRLERLPTNLSADTIDSMVFHYLFAGEESIGP